MAYDFEEQEQIEELKAWWARYGGFLLTVLVIVSVTVAGWRLWGWYQARQAGKAAVALSVLREAVRTSDLPKVRAAATTLEAEHASSIYAPMGALLAAKAQFEAGELDPAAQSLRWVLEHAADSEFEPIARQRLAAVLLQQGKAADALALLEQGPSQPAFRATFADRRGDILLEMGRTADARKAYQEALEQLGPRASLRSSVQAKLDALGSDS
ncbi:MAG: tetratricopeptide repeat protein [Burkholderiaceae bacterium]